MKLVRAILKDLQDSGQRVSIVGHFAVQPCHLQGVTNVNDVCDQPETTPLSTDGNQNTNRYITEHEQNGAARYERDSPVVVLTPELFEIIEIWPNLPDSVKTGILAMVQAVSDDRRLGRP